MNIYHETPKKAHHVSRSSVRVKWWELNITHWLECLAVSFLHSCVLPS